MMDVQAKTMVQNLPILMEKMKSNKTIPKSEKYRYLLEGILILDDILEFFTSKYYLCCEISGPKEDCELNTVVNTMCQALEELIDYVPTACEEMINSQYMRLTTALDRMHSEARHIMITFENCSMTYPEIKNWGEIVGTLQMLLFSRYPYSQSKSCIPEDTPLFKDEPDEFYHKKIWIEMGQKGYLLPIVKYSDGIDKFVKKNFAFIQNILDSSLNFSCSKCDARIHNPDDCAILDTCEHLVCIKCAYRMAVNNDVICKLCKKKASKWTTKHLLQLSKEEFPSASEIKAMALAMRRKKYMRLGGLLFVASSILVAVSLFTNFSVSK